jgi:hypothetical protein
MEQFNLEMAWELIINCPKMRLLMLTAKLHRKWKSKSVTLLVGKCPNG